MTVFGWGWFFDRCVSARVHFFGPGSALNCGICLELRVFYDEITACQVFPDIPGSATGSGPKAISGKKTSNFLQLEAVAGLKRFFGTKLKFFPPDSDFHTRRRKIL